MQYKEFELVSEEKLRRVAEGNDGGVKGIGWEDKNALAVAYDKVGGLILKNGRKVKNGVFWDFKKKVVREKPLVIFQIGVNGKIVEVPEGEELPLEVQAAELLAKAEAEKSAEEEVEEEPVKKSKKVK